MKKRVIALGLFVAILISFLTSGKTHALLSNDIQNKILAEGAARCYSGNTSTGEKIVKGEIKLYDFQGIKSVMLNNSTEYVPLPNTMTTTLTRDTVSCLELFTMSEGFVGILRRNNTSTATTTTIQKKEFLEKLGYKVSSNSEVDPNKRCTGYNIVESVNGNLTTLTTQSICTEDGSASTDKISVTSKGSGPVTLEKSGTVIKVTMTGETKEVEIGSDYQALVDRVGNIIRSKYSNTSATKVDDESVVTIGNVDYDLPNDRFEAGLTAVNNILGTSFSGPSSLNFTPGEKYQLYYNYLTNYYKIETGSCESDANFEDPKDGSKKMPMPGTDKVVSCYVKPTEHDGDKVNGLSGFRFLPGNQKTWENLTEELENIKDQLTLEEMTAAVAATKVPSSNGDGTVSCSSSGGAGALGWIVCPLIDFATGAVEDAYNWVTDSLIVNPQLFSQTEGSGSLMAWEVFRGLANTLFVIFLIVIIFSQITGVGIDNYGIKKMLPKLIIAAVLVNLSYIICILLIDLSNILGGGIKALFDSLPAGSPVTQLAVEGGAVDVSYTVDLIGVGLLAGIAGSIFAIISNPMIVLSLLVSAFGMLISLFFVFILLSVRQAAILILTVMSPIAVVLYVLPNSRNIFNRYIKIFSALLLLFPTCALAFSGGNYVSRLLMFSGFGNAGLPQAFTAIAVGVAPLFFIPSLVKNSMAALGGIGSSISNLGSRLNRGATSAMRNSGTYRQAGEEAEYRRKLRSAQRTANRLENKQGRSVGESRRLNRAYAVIQGAKTDELKAQEYQMSERYGNMNQSEMDAAWEEKFNSNSNDLEAFTNYYHSRYGAAAVNKMATIVSDASDIEKNETKQASIRTLQSTIAKNSSLSSDMRRKTSDLFEMVSNGGTTGAGENREFHGLGHFSKASNLNKNVQDWSTQTTRTLERAIQSDALGEGMIQEMLNTDDPTIKSALLTDSGKRDLLQAASYAKSNGIQFDFGYHSDDIQKMREHEQRIADLAKAYRASNSQQTSQPTPVRNPQAGVSPAERRQRRGGR